MNSSFGNTVKLNHSAAIAGEVSLTRDEKRRIEELAASFVEGSGFLMGLSDSITRSVKVYVAEEQRRRREHRDR